MGDSIDKGHLATSEKPWSEHIEGEDLDSRILAVKRLHDGQEHTSDHRLVVDIKEAEREYGAEVASTLKTTEDGTCILWPQPRDDPHDPLNVRAAWQYVTEAHPKSSSGLVSRKATP